MNAFQVYWRVYGGWQAIFLSPYFLLSGVFWAFCKPLWFSEAGGPYLWAEWGITIIPSMLAFSLGAMAIFLAFANERFLRLLRQGGDESSYLMNVVAAFFHFILVQFFSIACAIILMTYPFNFFSAVAFFSFCYALACGIAASAALLDMADILNQMGKLDDDSEE